MKYTLLLIPVLFSFIVNVNTWGVKLNDKDLYNSTQKNPKDTISLDTKAISKKDSLTFNYHVCGHTGSEMKSFLIVNSENNKTLINYTNNYSSFVGAHVKIPADTIANLQIDNKQIKTSLCWQNMQTKKTDTLMTWTFQLK